jgi:hypothetical protein
MTPWGVGVVERLAEVGPELGDVAVGEGVRVAQLG